MPPEPTAPKPALSRHPAFSGIAGALLAAVATIVGALIGNSGAASGVLPGNPTVTVSTTVTPAPAPGPTVTVPGPTVTVSAGSAETPTTDASAIHLADEGSVPDDLIADLRFDPKSDLKINGKTFDFGWTAYDCGSCNPSLVASLNLNQSYKTFAGRIGVDGTSDNSTGKLEVIADGKVIWAKSVGVSKSDDVKLTVDGVQRLEIRELQPSGDIIYAIGDPTVE